MNPSDSLQLDENLAKLLAAYDQSIEGADSSAKTISMQRTAPPPSPPLGEKLAQPLNGKSNEASLGEVLPDIERGDSAWLPKLSPQTFPGPHRVGRFELRRQLGKGGCGIVFLAFDPKLEREVALKIPRPEMLLSSDARRRLIREALAAAEFDHPNLVPVYETGEIGPVCFIATAFCPGLTLGEWLEKQSFSVPIRQAARLVALLAEAVQHAHDRGVLHRDLKPNNIILQAVREDPNEQEPPIGSCQLRGYHYIPRVVDFGLAKLLERGGPSETATRQILGTPKYMAPEQAQARHDDVGPPADVYALGVILYELLTGRAPYEGASDVEVLRQAIDGHLTQPRHLRQELPRDLEAICLKAMSRSPSRRYRTAIDFADDLRRFLDGKPTIARPLNFFGRTGRWLRRNDQAVALGVVTSFAALLMTFWVLSRYQTHQLRSDRDVALQAQAERTRADRRREYSRRVRDAFLAWNAGALKEAASNLDAATQLARLGGESIDFAHGYLARLIAAGQQTMICPEGSVTALGISSDGAFLATGHANGMLGVWRRATGERLASVPAHERAIVYLDFSKPGKLTSADLPSTAKSWVITPTGELTFTGKPTTPILFPPPGPAMVRFENATYTSGADGIVRTWEADRYPHFYSSKLNGLATAIGVHSDANRFSIATLDQLSLGEVGTTALQSKVMPLPIPLILHFPKDKPLRAITLGEGAARVSENQGNGFKEQFRFQEDGAAVTAIALSMDGSKLATGNNQGSVNVWKCSDQSSVNSFYVGQNEPIKNLSVSDDGKSVAALIHDRLILWIANESTPRVSFPCDEQLLFRITPDGSRLVMTQRGGVIKVWNNSEAQEEHTLYGHAGQVTGLGVSPNGRSLVSGGIQGEVKFWDLRLGQELMNFNRHLGPVRVIEFSTNGKLLVTAGRDWAVWQIAKD